MDISRSEFLGIAGAAALRAAMNRTAPRESWSRWLSPDFDINAEFASFMRGIGGTPADGGGSVTFVGSDPLLRSHFRIGASMALPAMAAGVGAAAIWKAHRHWSGRSCRSA